MRRSNRCVRMMNRTVMQGRKESLWSQLLGVTYALTVVFTPGEGQLSISLGGHEWVDAAVSGGDRAGGGPAGAAGDRVRHLEGEPAGSGGLAGDRQGGQRHRAPAGIQDRLNLNLPQLTTATVPPRGVVAGPADCDGSISR
jgi:hypothetical protein